MCHDMCKRFGRVGEKIVKGWRRCGYLCRSAKGATEATCETEGKLLISIHAPAKGAIFH